MYVKLGVLIYLANTTNVSSDLSLRPTFASDILVPNNFFLASYAGCSPDKLTNEFTGLRAKNCPVNYKVFNAPYRAE